MQKDKGHWKVRTRLEKRDGDINACRTPEERLKFLQKPAKEVIEREGNLLLNEGINAMWTLICGGSETAYDNSNARIGVGNGTDAASATQTGLQGGSTEFKAMETGYPEYGSDQKAVFKASFGESEANFDWEEWTVDNGSGDEKNMNRKVESKGTKDGGTWTFTVEISLS